MTLEGLRAGAVEFLKHPIDSIGKAIGSFKSWVVSHFHSDTPTTHGLRRQDAVQHKSDKEPVDLSDRNVQHRDSSASSLNSSSEEHIYDTPEFDETKASSNTSSQSRDSVASSSSEQSIDRLFKRDGDLLNSVDRSIERQRFDKELGEVENDVPDTSITSDLENLWDQKKQAAFERTSTTDSLPSLEGDLDETATSSVRSSSASISESPELSTGSVQSFSTQPPVARSESPVSSSDSLPRYSQPDDSETSSISSVAKESAKEEFGDLSLKQMQQHHVAKGDENKETKRMAALDRLSGLIDQMTTVNKETVASMRTEIDSFKSTKWFGAGESKGKAAELHQQLDQKIKELKADDDGASFGDRLKDRLRELGLKDDPSTLIASMATESYKHIIDKEEARRQGLGVIQDAFDTAKRQGFTVGEEYDKAIAHLSSGKSAKESFGIAAELKAKIQEHRQALASTATKAQHQKRLDEMKGMSLAQLYAVEVPKDNPEKQDVRRMGLQRLGVTLEQQKMTPGLAKEYKGVVKHFSSSKDEEIKGIQRQLQARINEKLSDDKAVSSSGAQSTFELNSKKVELDEGTGGLNLSEKKTASEMATVTIPSGYDDSTRRMMKKQMQDKIAEMLGQRIEMQEKLRPQEKKDFETAIKNCTKNNLLPTGNRKRLMNMLNEA